MDFLDPNKKKAHVRRLFLGYFLVGVAIALASVILLVLSNGYDVDRKTGKVIQNGLIFVASAPEKTGAYLNGVSQGTTDRRLTVPEGHYNVELKRDGYDSWKKTIDLEGGSIERLIYPRLFPTKLATAQAKTYDAAPSFWTQSPDRHWLIVGHPSSLTDYDLFNSNDPTAAPTVLQLPAGLLTAGATAAPQVIKTVEWSTDNRHLIVEHTYDQTDEFILVDISQPANSLNINKLFAVQPTAVTLRDKKADRLYLYTATTRLLQAGEVKTKKITDLLTGVVSFHPYQSNTILYAAEDAKLPGKVVVRLLDNDQNYTVASFPTTPILLEMASFNGDQYVVAAPVNEGRMYIYKDPLSRLKSKPGAEVTPYALMRLANLSKISFSTNTRFVSAQSGSKFAIYDFEEDRRYNFSLPGVVLTDQLATWMDGHRLLINQDSSVIVFEFDGNNQRHLGNITPGIIPYFDRDYVRLFTLTSVKDSKAISLTRTSLKLKLKP